MDEMAVNLRCVADLLRASSDHIPLVKKLDIAADGLSTGRLDVNDVRAMFGLAPLFSGMNEQQQQ